MFVGYIRQLKPNTVPGLTNATAEGRYKIYYIYKIYILKTRSGHLNK